MAEEIKVAAEMMEKLVTALMATNASLADHVKQISETKTASSEFQREREKLLHQYKTEEANLKKAGAGYKEQKKVLGDIEKKYKTLYSTYSSTEKAFKKLEKGIDENTSRWKKLGKSMFSAKTATKGMSAVLGPQAVALGALGMGVEKVVEAFIKYNDTLHTLTRTQNVAGRGMDDMGAAIKIVRDNVALSDQSFMEFANTINSMAIGIKPTNAEMAKLSVMIERTMGPGLERAQAGAKALFSVQQKFPRLYGDIRKTMELLSKAQSAGSEEAKAAILEQVAAMRGQIAVTMRQTGESQQSIEGVLQLMTERTAAEKELTAVQQERANIEKEIGNAQIALGEAFRPILLGILKGVNATIEAMKWLGTDTLYAAAAVGALAAGMKGAAWASSIGLATKATAGLTTGFKALTAAMAANPFVVIATAAAIAFVASKKYYNQMREAQKQEAESAVAANKQAVALQAQRKAHKEVVNLSKAETGEYEKMWATYAKGVNWGVDGTEKAQKIHKAILKVMNGEKGALRELAKASTEGGSILQLWSMEHGKILVDLERETGLVNQITKEISAQVDLAEKYGVVRQDILAMLRQQTEEEAKLAAVALEKTLDNLAKFAAVDLGIELDLDDGGSLDSRAKDLQVKMSKVKLDAITPDQKKALDNYLRDLTSLTTKSIAAEGKVVDTAVKGWTSRRDQMNKFNADYSSNLDAQRKLMESAQFGLGASIAMMQKQIDLSYHQLQITKESIDLGRQDLLNSTKINKAGLAALENARSHAEAQDIASKYAAKESTEYKLLVAYSSEYQKNSKAIADQQQKIYDLTKNIREGYLDAIREMSVGAGEFTKIIGTQEMGVTQLMNSVKDVTGVAKANSMALGGLSEAVGPDSARSKVAGGYSQGGLYFEGQATTEAKNREIYGYAESQQQFKQMQQGQGGAPTAGSGVAGGREKQYIDTFRGQADANQQGTLKALTQWSAGQGGRDLMDAVNGGLKKNGFGGFNKAGSGSGHGSSAMGAMLTAGSQAPAPARNAPHRAPGPIDLYAGFNTGGDPQK